jgi:RHS repeat-associated protein
MSMMNDTTAGTFHRLIAYFVIWAHLGTSATAFAQDTALPATTPMTMSIPHDLLVGTSLGAAAPVFVDPNADANGTADASAAAADALALTLPAPKALEPNTRLGQVQAETETIAAEFEAIANLARRIRATGVAAPTPGAVQSERGDREAVAVAREIVRRVTALGAFEELVVAQWQGEREQMEQFGVDAGVARRSDALISEFSARAAEFRQIYAPVAAAASSGARADAATALLALADFFAQQDNARGFRAIEKARLPFQIAQASATPELVVDETRAPEQIAAVFDPPTAADLAQTIEVQFTAEIQALALELGNNPVAIRNWVYDNVAFDPTHGSAQGAALTLLNRHGNAMDIASLTIAILRAAGVPSRYAYGAVELPADKVRNWLGNMPTSAMAVDLMQKGQIPSVGVVNGGQIRAVQFQHVWVEAYVDFVPSRGAINTTPDQWVPIDAAFKQFEYTAPINWRARTDPAFTQAARTFAQGVTVAPDGGISGFDFDTLDQSLQAAALDAAQDIVGADPDTTPAELYERAAIIPADRVMLDGALPYRLVSPNVTRFSAVPASLQHVLKIAFYADQQSFNYENPTRVADVVMARVGTQRLAVDYAPATAADAQAIAAYAASNAESMPLAQINVLTRVKLGDDVILDAGATRMGTQHLWTVDLKDSHGGRTVTEAYKFAAGSRIVFVPNPAGVTPQRAERETENVPDRALLPINDMLYFAGQTFWMLHDRVDTEAAQHAGARALRLPSIGAFAAPLEVSYFFGLPRTGKHKGFVTDAKAVRLAIATERPEDTIPVSLHLGAGGSLAESTAWNFTTGAPLSNPGLSATSIIRAAIDQGQPIYQIDSSNVTTALAAMQLSADAESEIRNAANAGLLIIAPKNEIRNRGWSGSGYVIIDRNSGSALHRVEGGLSGGINVGCISQAVLLQQLCERMIMKKAMEFLGRLILRSGIAAVAESLMLALLGPAGVAIGGVVIIVAVAVSYAMAAYEVYQWIKMIEAGIDSLTPEQLAELGINTLNDVMCSYSPPCLGGGFGGGGGGGGGPGGGGGGPLAGNPTAIGSGAKWQSENDFTGGGPFPLQFTRTYASNVPRAGSLIGAKWSASYFMQLRLPPQLDGSPFPNDERPDAVLLVRPDGGWYQYNWRGTGYVGDSNIPGTLTRLTSGANTTGWTYLNIADETETYDANGRLLSITSRAGIAHTLGYDPQGRLSTVTDSFGRTLTFGYGTTSQQLETLTDPAGKITRYTHDENGNLTSVRYPDTRTRTYHYENLVNHFLLTGITDERNIRTSTWRYDAQGRVTLAERADGADRYTFDYGYLQTTVVDPLLKSRTYSYVQKYDRLYLESMTEPCSDCGSGGNTETTYNGAGYVASVTDFRSNRTTYSRDARGLVTSMTEAAGTPLARTVSTTWHPVWRLPTRITEPTAAGTRITLFAYDERGNLLSHKTTVGAESRTTTWTYDAYGQVLTEDGPRTDVVDVTTSTYVDGNRATLTDAAGHTVRYTAYDDSGNLVERIDQNGLKTTYTRDERYRVEAISQLAAGETAPQVDEYDYDAAGNLVTLHEAGGNTITIPHDGANRATGSEDGLGNKIVYTLDGAGNITLVTTRDPSNAIVATEKLDYDELGRLVATHDADDNTVEYEYDGNGNEIGMTDALEHATTSTYDALDRLETVTDAEENDITLGYDPDDNIARVTDSRALVTNYTYNGFGDLTRTQSPDAGTAGFEYDAAGNLVRTLDARGSAGEFIYDAIDRPTRITYADERIDLGYDAASGGDGARGNLTSVDITVQNGASTTIASGERHRYDGHGRLIERTQLLGAAPTTATTRITGYSYAADELVDTMTLPSGTPVRYTYGADGRVLTIAVNGQIVVREIEYFPTGEPKSWRYGSGSERYERTFDNDGRIVAHDVGTTQRTVDYDAAGRIAAIADAGAGSTEQWTFGYSDADRLTDAHNAASAGPFAQRFLAWQYDDNGNRLAERNGTGALPPAATTTYTIANGSNRLDAVAGDARQFDAAGNTTRFIAQRGDLAGSALDATYSGRGRLVQLRVGGVPVARYAYDSMGQRIAKWTGADAATLANAPTRQFVYSETQQLLGEYDGSGALVAEHLWLDETPVGVIVPSGNGLGGMSAGGVSVLFVHPDHLDTPRAIVNDAEQLVWQWQATPFGDADAQSQPGALPPFDYALRLPGQYFDRESGTHYNIARDYEPGTGRYGMVDPMGLDAGINPYAYALNSPLDISDPDGQFPKFPKPKPPKPPKPNPSRCTGPNVHPNCRNYKGKCYVYTITAPDGSLYKYGESCKPGRCERQIRKLNRGKPPGAPRYTCDKIKDFCSKGDARDYENGKITDYKKANCGCRPPGNKNDH